MIYRVTSIDLEHLTLTLYCLILTPPVQFGTSHVTRTALPLCAGALTRTGGCTPGHVTSRGSDGLLFSRSVVVDA